MDFDLNPNISVSNYWNIFDKRLNRHRSLTTCHIGNTYYQYVDIIVAEWKRKFAVHRLVAYIFLWLDIFDSKQFVIHLDDNWLNNNVNNLEVWDNSLNAIDSVNKWRWNSPEWENHYRCKLTDTEIETIKLLYSKWGIAQRRIWEIYWVWQDHISRIINNKVRKN